jgi:hypothetical protein
MTIKELKKLLKGIPDNFDIAIETGEQSLMPICPTDSGVIQLEFNDTKEKRFVFILAPCSCPPENESQIESEINLN